MMNEKKVTTLSESEELEEKIIVERMGDTNIEGTNNKNTLPVEKNQIDVYRIENCNLGPEITTDIKDGEICNGLVKAQEKFIAGVDENFLEDDTLESPILDEITEAKESGAFIPTKYLTLIYGNEKTTKIFAKRVVRNGNRGEPVIVFAYKDGEVSPEIEVKMAELMRISYGNFGEPQEGINKKDVAHAEALINKIGERILPYWEFDLEIRVVGLIKVLSKNISSLAVDRGNELDITLIYHYIYKYVQKLKDRPDKGYFIRKGFYALTREDMLEVASGLDSTAPKIIEILKQHNLLYLQNSSIGNQCEVKGVGSCYCIKMLAKFQPKEVEIFKENAFDEL